MQEQVSYRPAIKVLHWLIVATVALDFLVAWVMPGIRRTAVPSSLVDLHMSIGLLLIPFVLVLIGLRFFSPAPPFPVGMPRWQAFAARLMHYALYILLILLPLAGWIFADIRGLPVTVFGWYTLPVIATQGSLFSLLGGLHSLFASLIGFLILGHGLAALWHYFIDRDGVMEEMLFVRHASPAMSAAYREDA